MAHPTFTWLTRRFDVHRLAPRSSLRTALLVYVMLPPVIVMALIAYLTTRAFEHRAEEQMKDDVQLVARAISEPLSRSLERDRKGSVDGALASAIGINRVYGAYVYDLQGRTIAAAGAVNPAPDRLKLAELVEDGSRQGEYDDLDGRAVYSYFVPLTNSGGRTTALLHVTRRARDMRDSTARLRRQMGAILMLSVLLVGGVVLYGHHGAVGRYVERLSTAMRRVKEGDREHRARLEGPREIAALAGSLNTMLDSISRAEDEIAVRREEIAARQEEEVTLRRKLRHSEKLASIGRLAAGVAHELGTPLSVIDGHAQRLLRRDGLEMRSRTAVEEVRREVSRMEHIVRQLLDFGRKEELRRRRVDAREPAEIAVRVVKEDRVSVELAGPSVPVLIDPIRIQQVLVNLIKNAVESTASRVRVSWRVTETELEYVVEDDGPGVDPALQSRIFEPFFTTRNVGTGTGLGLAVVHGIVEEHGGTVDVDESAMGGARFRIVCPRLGVRPVRTEAAHELP